ncbi:hypothetical protein TNCV_4584591 [Trichonephila clavipes]|nr:hypothetical protein TNCV_4584591 [Trichonephila clavipes]
MRKIDCNGVELTINGLWTCGKLFFGVMNLTLQSGRWMRLGLVEAHERFFSNYIVPTVKFGGGSIMV